MKNSTLMQKITVVRHGYGFPKKGAYVICMLPVSFTAFLQSFVPNWKSHPVHMGIIGVWFLWLIVDDQVHLHAIHECRLLPQAQITFLVYDASGEPNSYYAEVLLHEKNALTMSLGDLLGSTKKTYPTHVAKGYTSYIEIKPTARVASGIRRNRGAPALQVEISYKCATIGCRWKAMTRDIFVLL